MPVSKLTQSIVANDLIRNEFCDRDISIAAQQSPVLCYDNLENLSHEMADAPSVAAASGSMTRTPSVTRPPETCDLYGIVRDHLKERLTKMPTIPLGQPRSLKQICSEDFWFLLTDGDRRWAGQYVAIMVKNGALPLAEVPHSHEYPKKYCSI